MRIEETIKKLYESIHKVTFVLMALGMVVYSPFWTKQLNSADVNVYGYLYHIEGYQYEDALGRFFIKYLVNWRNDINSNVLIIPLCVLILAGIAELIIRIFDIKSSIIAFLTGSVIMFSAFTADLFSYVYTADVYCIAYFLVALAAYILVKTDGKKKYLIAGALLFISMGIYQAFVGFAILLLTICFLKDILCTFEENENKGLKAVKIPFFNTLFGYVTIAGSMVIYLVIFKILDMVGYLKMETDRGSNSIMGNFITSIGESIGKIYTVFFQFFFTNDMNYNSWFGRKYIHIALFLMCFLLMGILLFKDKKYKNIYIVILTALVIVVIPVIMCLIVILAPGSSVYAETGPLMLAYMTGVFLVPLVLADGAIDTKKGWLLPLTQSGIKVFAFLLVLIMIVFIEVFAKEVELDQNQLTLLANRMIYSMEAREDFEPMQKVLVVGRPHSGNYPLPDENFELITKNMISHYSQIFGANDQIAIGWIRAFDYYAGVKFTPVSREEMEALLSSDEVKQMEIYPDTDSIHKIGDITVIKLSDYRYD